MGYCEFCDCEMRDEFGFIFVTTECGSRGVCESDRGGKVRFCLWTLICLFLVGGGVILENQQERRLESGVGWVINVFCFGLGIRLGLEFVAFW